MKTTRIYPAVFREEAGQVTVEFPDLGLATCGETMEHAYKKAQEALALRLDNGDFVAPTALEKIIVEDGARVMYVEADNADNIIRFKRK